MSRTYYYESLANHYAQQSDWEYYQIYRQKADNNRAALKQLDHIQNPMTVGFVSTNKTLIINQ